jgi:diguanylate cyclase (GGDEF)-like protein
MYTSRIWRRVGEKEELHRRHQPEPQPTFDVYLRRQRILQKLFSDTGLLFKCRVQTGDLMSKQVCRFPPTATADELRIAMKKHNVMHVFVCDGEQFLGIVHYGRLRGHSDTPASRLLDTRMARIDEDVPLSQAITQMISEGHSVLAVMHGDELLGELTLTDLAITLQCTLQIFLRMAQAVQSSGLESDLRDGIAELQLTAKRQQNAILDLTGKLDSRAPSSPSPENVDLIRERLSEIEETCAELTGQMEGFAGRVEERIGKLMSLFEIRIDEETGLCNRKSLTETLDSLCALKARYGQAVSLLLVRPALEDNSFGMQPGQSKLRAWANWLMDEVRDSDMTARANKDSFAIVLPHADAAATSRFARRLHASYQTRCHGAADSLITASSTAEKSDDAASLMERAFRGLETASATCDP